jgi:ATP-binding cassette, subfamily A (ABC1), member 3
VANPQVEFLDEPTTGVDPIARRSLFKMLKQLRSSSILLTTHRMDEAESLCDKIAIMINGKFVCYGSPGHLKQKYGKGYEIIVKPLPGQLPDYLDREILMRLPFCRRELAIDQ